MPAPNHDQLGLVPFTSCDPVELGACLSDIVSRNRGSLAVDFPNLPARYANAKLGEQAVLGARQHMERSVGSFAAFAACYDNQVIGVVTASQSKLSANPQNLAGPLIAYWLDEARPAEQRRIGVPLLKKLVGHLASMDAIYGHAWTVVRLPNYRSARILEDEANGFDGFVPVGDPDTWPVEDGVTEPRQLYVSRVWFGARHVTSRS